MKFTCPHCAATLRITDAYPLFQNYEHFFKHDGKSIFSLVGNCWECGQGVYQLTDNPDYPNEFAPLQKLDQPLEETDIRRYRLNFEQEKEAKSSRCRKQASLLSVHERTWCAEIDRFSFEMIGDHEVGVIAHSDIWGEELLMHYNKTPLTFPGVEVAKAYVYKMLRNILRKEDFIESADSLRVKHPIKRYPEHVDYYYEGPPYMKDLDHTCPECDHLCFILDAGLVAVFREDKLVYDGPVSQKTYECSCGYKYKPADIIAAAESTCNVC